MEDFNKIDKEKLKDPNEAKLYLNTMLNNKSQQTMAIKLLCNEVFDDVFFVNILLANIKSKNKDDFIIKDTRSTLKKITERLVLVMERLK